jgi:two-component system, OmpR family, phosphate regulon sensor histidine kinase PhoR
MWFLVAFLVLALALLLLGWRRRERRVREELERQRDLIDRLQHQQEQQAAQGRAQLQALFNGMVEGVLLLDRYDRIQLVNQTLQQLVQAGQELRGRTIMEAFRLHELSQIVHRTLYEGQVLGHELELPGPSRRFFQVNAVSVRDDDKEPQGVMVVFHDITRLKQLENTRQEFVANVSHELRTPLSLIKGYAETLFDGAKDDPEIAGRFLQTIIKHTDRLTYLIEDLLTVSQLESGQSVLNLQEVELRALVERVLEDLKSRAETRKAALRNEVPGELKSSVDANRLQQVLFNLVDNAIKYGRSEGTVVVSARQVEPGRIEVSVRDDGPGIPPEAIERVFERFYRVDRARSREQGGTGLGLSIVKHIVQLHGGEVWARSELGKGTTFFFSLVRPEE